MKGNIFDPAFSNKMNIIQRSRMLARTSFNVLSTNLPQRRGEALSMYKVA